MEQLYFDKVTETIIFSGDSYRLSWTHIMIEWNDKFFYKIHWGDKSSYVISLYHCYYREVGNDNSWDTTTVFSWGTTTSHALRSAEGRLLAMPYSVVWIILLLISAAAAHNAEDSGRHYHSAQLQRIVAKRQVCEYARYKAYCCLPPKFIGFWRFC